MVAPGTIRTWLTVLAIAAAGYGGWRLIRKIWRSDADRQHAWLVSRHDHARQRIGHALDPLLDELAAGDRTTINLVNRGFEISPALPAAYHDSYVQCSDGLSDAFDQALGPEVIHVSADGGSEGTPSSNLILEAHLVPSGEQYRLPHGQHALMGIIMRADLVLLGKRVHVEVSPGHSVEFMHHATGLETQGTDDDEVARAVVQGACKQAGLEMLAKLTDWRPPPPRAPDPVADCEQGVNCRAAAMAQPPERKEQSVELLVKACDDKDVAACTLAAEAAARIDPSSGTFASALAALARVCRFDRQIEACQAAAHMASLPGAKRAGEARDLTLQACDLGAADSCAAAAPMIAKLGLDDAPFPEGAAVLTKHVPQHLTKLAGASLSNAVVFAVKWGELERFSSGAPIAWLASKQPLELPGRLVALAFERGDVPAGITPPPELPHIYAVAVRQNIIDDQRCPHCASSQQRSRFEPTECICVLQPYKD